MRRIPKVTRSTCTPTNHGNTRQQPTLNMRLSSSISDLPGKSGFFMRNSAKMQPTDHISMGVLYSFSPRRSSGARYHSVTTIGVYGRRGEPYSRARPKSPICVNKQTVAGLRIFNHHSPLRQGVQVSNKYLDCADDGNRLRLMDFYKEWNISHMDLLILKRLHIKPFKTCVTLRYRAKGRRLPIELHNYWGMAAECDTSWQRRGEV